MNNKYDATFRAEAIRLALSSPESIAKTARDLGIKEGTLYNWVSTAQSKCPTVTDEQGNRGNLVEELNRLRKENARLREEREILKKATLFFAKETK